jgi:hypothetical protein
LKSKITEIPISYLTRSKNSLGKGADPCVASGRWLKFPAVSPGHFKDGEFILLKVMTKDKNNSDKIICKLVVTRKNLLDAINFVKSPTE